MNITTATAAATKEALAATAMKEDFLVQVDGSSVAGLRIETQRSILVNGVVTDDTTGMTVAPGKSIRLPGDRQVWLFSTATDGVAASFEIMAIEADRR